MTAENPYAPPRAGVEQAGAALNQAGQAGAVDDWQLAWFRRSFWTALALWGSFLAIVVARPGGFLEGIANYLAWSSWVVGFFHLYLLTKMAARVGESPGKWVVVVVLIPLGYLFSYARISKMLKALPPAQMQAHAAEVEARAREQRSSNLLAFKALLVFLALLGAGALITRYL